MNLESELRDALQARAASAPVPDATPPAPGRPPLGRPLALAAAAFVVIVAGVAIIATRGDEAPSVAIDTPTSPPVVTTAPDLGDDPDVAEEAAQRSQGTLSFDGRTYVLDCWRVDPEWAPVVEIGSGVVDATGEAVPVAAFDDFDPERIVLASTLLPSCTGRSGVASVEWNLAVVDGATRAERDRVLQRLIEISPVPETSPPPAAVPAPPPEDVSSELPDEMSDEAPVEITDEMSSDDALDELPVECALPTEPPPVPPDVDGADEFDAIVAGIVGRWVGTPTVPIGWPEVGPVWIEFRADGTYRSGCLGDEDVAAFSYSTNNACPQSTYELVDLNANGSVEGNIEISWQECSDTTRGALGDIRLLEPNRLTFEFAPTWLGLSDVIRYDLERDE